MGYGIRANPRARMCLVGAGHPARAIVGFGVPKRAVGRFPVTAWRQAEHRPGYFCLDGAQCFMTHCVVRCCFLSSCAGLCSGFAPSLVSGIMWKSKTRVWWIAFLALPAALWMGCGDSGTTGPVCGNGILEEGEECDDGNNIDGDGCSADCRLERVRTRCGNGLIQGDQECDDGNTEDGDGCSSTCTVEEGWTCSGEPSVCVEEDPSEVEAVCGNGVIEGDQACDDGNTEDGDGCSSTCTIEEGWTCSGEPSACFRRSEEGECGNGVINRRQECDDGNTEDGDGCSSTCTIEEGWTCIGEPSQCREVSRCEGVSCTHLDTACTYGVCSTETGECVERPRADGDLCDDGDECTVNARCVEGVCEGGEPRDCSSLSGGCSSGTCEPGVGCVGSPIRDGEPCGDPDNACMAGVCDQGECVAEPVSDCTSCGSDGLSRCVEGTCLDPQMLTETSFEGAELPPGFESEGNAPWRLTTAHAVEGTQSARSGAIGDSQRSTLRYTLKTHRPVTLRFQYRVSSEQGFDFFTFTANGQELLRRSGQTGWQEASFPLEPGTWELRWTYQKDPSFAGFEDAVYLDALRFEGLNTCDASDACSPILQGVSSCVACPLEDGEVCNASLCSPGFCQEGACVVEVADDCEACGEGGRCVDGACRYGQTERWRLDFENGTPLPSIFTTTTSAPWVIRAGVGVDGSRGLASHRFGVFDVGRSVLQMRVQLEGEGRLGFSFSTVGSAFDDFFVAVNGTRVGPIFSGSNSWRDVEVVLPRGNHVVQFVYDFSFGTISGRGEAYVDNLYLIDNFGCDGSAECSVEVGSEGDCVVCPADDGDPCPDGSCEAGICLPDEG